jgi:hypothetical protein
MLPRSRTSFIAATTWSEHGWYAYPDLDQAEIVFQRKPRGRGRPSGSRSQRQTPAVTSTRESDADLVLLGCVSQKGPVPAPAGDLYLHYGENDGHMQKARGNRG